MSEETEFAYFAGLREGAAMERQRIVFILEKAKAENKPLMTWQYALAWVFELINGQSQVDSDSTETETPCQCKKQP